MIDGTTITVGPNDIGNITFNSNGPVAGTMSLGEWIESLAKLQNVEQLRAELHAIVENNENENYQFFVPLAEYFDQSYWDRKEIGEALVALLAQLRQFVKENQDQISYLEEKHDADITEIMAMLSDCTDRIEALEAGGGETDPPVQGSLCPDSNHPHMIDLGLPSGVKWACCNVDASKPEEYGGYYAWGETEEKSSYTRENYAHYSDFYDDVVGVIGTPYISRTIYDVAYVKWGTSWRMHTSLENWELMEKCSLEWTQLNGVNGMKVTGPNGNSIFMPAAGSWSDQLNNVGNKGYYWSGDPYAYYSVGGLELYDNSYYLSGFSCFNGYSIRAVYVDNPTDYPNLKLSSQSLVMENGDVADVLVISGSDSYAFSIDNENVATAELTGFRIKVTALNVGKATITVTDTKSGQTVTMSLTVTAKYDYNALCPDDNHPHMINLGFPDGTLWSCCNVGASSPEDYGGYYAWGETEVKSSYNMDNYIHKDEESDIWDFYDISETKYDVAYVKWGAPWRMPTMHDLDNLSKCTIESTQVNSVSGVKFTGPNGRSIFLPSAGYYDDYFNNDVGHYWSGTRSYQMSSVMLYDAYIGGDWNCCNGLSVRPVAK